MEKNDLEPVFYRGSRESDKIKPSQNYEIKNKALLTAKHLVNPTTKIADGVFSSEALSPAYCSELLEEVENASQMSTALNRTGVDLLSLNFEVVINNIIAALLPTIKQVPEFNIGSNCTLSLLSAYVVGYRHNKPSHHPVHADDSDITLNINLGKTFVGGDLFFLDPVTKQIIASMPHSVGKAIIHAGELPHGAKVLSSGERYNLIIWLKKQYSFEQFSMLPKEVQRYALNSMDVRQLCRLSQTCKAMKAMIYEADSTWARFMPINDESEDDEGTNRQAVIDLYKQTKFSDKKLLLIVTELISTERVYFQSLKHAFVHGIKPLYEANADSVKDASIVTDLQQIVECHEMVLQEIDHCLDLQHTEGEINMINLVNIFDLLIQRIQSYANYVAKYEALQELLRKYADNKQVKKFLTEFQHLPGSNGLTLENFVIMPVRRVPRYQLLFSEMNKYTGSLSNGEDVFKLTQELTQKIQFCSTLINKSRYRQEQIEDNDDKHDEKSDSVSSEMFIFFLSSAVTRDLEVKQSKILDRLQTIRHQRLDKIVKLCGVPENSVHARNFKTKLCAEARTQKLGDCADKMVDIPGNILINLFITAQLPPSLFVRVLDMCNRMGYYRSFIDAHYIFGAFREVLKGRDPVVDEAAQYERLDYDEEGSGYLTRMTRLTSHIVDFLKKSTVLLCKVETFDSVIPQDESCRYAWINFLPNDRFLLCFVSFSEDVLYQQFVFVVKGKTTTGEIELADHLSNLYDVPAEVNDEYWTTMNRAWQELLELTDEQVKQISEFYDNEGWHSSLLQSFTNDSNEFAPETFIRVAKHLKIRKGIPGQTVTITIDIDESPAEDDV